MKADIKMLVERQSKEGADAFLEVLSSVSKKLIKVDLRREYLIQDSLEEIGRVVGVSRVYISLFSKDLKSIDRVYEWCEKGVSPEKKKLEGINTDLLPWWMSKLSWNDPIILEDLNQMSKGAEVEREILLEHGVKSVIVIPIYYRKSLLGYIGVDDIFKKRAWNEACKFLLKLLSDKFGSAIEKLRIEKERLKRLESKNIHMIGGTSNKIGFNLENFNEVVESVIDAISLDIDVFNDVDIDLSESLLKVRCNRIELSYLLSKVLECSIEGAREKISCLDDGQKRVYNYLGIKTYSEGSYIVCKIVDNGVAIKKEVLKDRLLEKSPIVDSHRGSLIFNKKAVDENEVTIRLPAVAFK